MKHKIYSKKQKRSSRAKMRDRNLNFAGAMHHIDIFTPDNKLIENFFLAMITPIFLLQNRKHLRGGF